jgi:hypothetical protein
MSLCLASAACIALRRGSLVEQMPPAKAAAVLTNCRRVMLFIVVSLPRSNGRLAIGCLVSSN